MRSMLRKCTVALSSLTFSAGAALAYAQTQSKRSPIHFGTNLRGAAAQVAARGVVGLDLGFRVDSQKRRSRSSAGSSSASTGSGSTSRQGSLREC